ncbi:MAG: hypothetical protein HY782_25100 [Chloroflexi bacterium]|nr:hypothetical protein [Chloroflexota bacterium]
MNRNNLILLTILMLASLALSACAQKPAAAAKIAPVKVEAIQGSKIKRLTLISDAAKRLDIKTTAVREEPFARTRKIGGEVVSMPTASAAADANQILVRVSLSPSDMQQIVRAEPAMVLRFTNPNLKPTGPAAAPALGITAKFVQTPAVADADPETELYFLVDQPNHGLATGQAVFVQVALAGNGKLSKAVPFSAVVYDKDGNAWTYTNPESLVYIRAPINVDYFEGDLAILTEGPAAGTMIVTVGASELYGAEVGVGK